MSFLLAAFSCNVSKNIIVTKDLNTLISKIECGSYDVKNYEKLIGYIVKPFVIEIENKESYIYQFELYLKNTYSNYYNKFYRVYWFSYNNKSEILLQVVMLSNKQILQIPNWQCEDQDVDIYTRNRKYLFDSEHPQFIVYNFANGHLQMDSR